MLNVKITLITLIQVNVKISETIHCCLCKKTKQDKTMENQKFSFYLDIISVLTSKAGYFDLLQVFLTYPGHDILCTQTLLSFAYFLFKMFFMKLLSALDILTCERKCTLSNL